MFQLLSVDEYGQKSIEGTAKTFEEAVSLGKGKVNEINVDNALTVYDKKKNWEAYFVELVDENGELVEDGFYTGRNNTGKHCAFSLVNEDLVLLDSVDGQVRIYLGSLDREDWFAETGRGVAINDIDHEDLAGKTVFFIRKA